MKLLKELLEVVAEPKEVDPALAAQAELKRRGVTVKKGQWSGKGSTYEVDGLKLTFYETTQYKNDGRLRNTRRTEYSIYATFFTKNGATTIDFGSAIGEGQTASAKMDAARDKAIRWAEQVCGISLGRFDFKH